MHQAGQRLLSFLKFKSVYIQWLLESNQKVSVFNLRKIVESFLLQHLLNRKFYLAHAAFRMLASMRCDLVYMVEAIITIRLNDPINDPVPNFCQHLAAFSYCFFRRVAF